MKGGVSVVVSLISQVVFIADHTVKRAILEISTVFKVVSSDYEEELVPSVFIFIKDLQQHLVHQV